MRLGRVVATGMAVAVAGALLACGKTGSLSNQIDDETGIVTYMADSATGGAAVIGATVTVSEGEMLAITPNLSSGSLDVQAIHEIVGDSTDFAPAVDDHLEGTTMRTYILDEGEYVLSVSVPEGETTTGTLTVSTLEIADADDSDEDE